MLFSMQGFYGEALFHRHKDRCIGDTACEPSQINTETLQKKKKKTNNFQN